jgi:hypothetical protein
MKISKSASRCFKASCVAVGLISCLAGSAEAALTAYYTLDDLSAGILNRGTNGANSDLSAPDAASTPTPVLDGIIGGALSFDGGDILRSLTAGNAGDALQAYPFTLSIWLRSATVDDTRDAAFGISDIADNGRYYVVGASRSGNQFQAEMVRRNPDFNALSASGTDVSGSSWTNVVAVFGPTNAQLYVGGKLAASATINQTFNPSVNTISIGGFLRNGGTHTDPFKGQADDAGLFDTALQASDVALINGLGLTGGLGLDWFEAAQALNAMAVGNTAQIGSATWQKVSGLTGEIGAFGGSVAEGTAYIVTDAAGNGIQVIPEPATAGLISLGVLGLIGRRSRRKVA